jgi:hypothetical protein
MGGGQVVHWAKEKDGLRNKPRLIWSQTGQGSEASAFR